MRAAVLEEPNVRALLEEFPDATLETIRPERSLTMPSLDEIMKMAEAAQAQLAQAQENLDKVEVEGVSGGGLVKIKATAKGRILGVSIDDSLLVPAEKIDARGSGRRGDQRCPGQGRCRRRRADAGDDVGTAASAGLQAALLSSSALNLALVSPAKRVRSCALIGIGAGE